MSTSRIEEAFERARQRKLGEMLDQELSLRQAQVAEQIEHFTRREQEAALARRSYEKELAELAAEQRRRTP